MRVKARWSICGDCALQGDELMKDRNDASEDFPLDDCPLRLIVILAPFCDQIFPSSSPHLLEQRSNFFYNGSTDCHPAFKRCLPLFCQYQCP